MNTIPIERDTELLINTQLSNLGWEIKPQSKNRNVYIQRVKTESQKASLKGKIPDYVLYQSDSDIPIAVIEAKRQGRNIQEAIEQGTYYAQCIDAPIVFATDGVFTKAVHVKFNKPLSLNNEELDELVREALALQFLNTSEVSTLDKKVIKSRGELIKIFEKVNDLLREEGLQQGLERFTEFANILFLKVLSEVEEAKELQGKRSNINRIYRWEFFCGKKGNELLSYVSDTVLKWFAQTYQDENLFKGLQIKHPDNLKEIIKLLNGLQLTDINADIKGDAFEYFIRSYSASNPSDLGEIFTPRHVVKTLVKLVNPKIGEKIYDPFCGTGGMLIVAFKHIMDSMAQTSTNIQRLKKSTLYGNELTRTASIAKMNMILAGDGHNNIARTDSLANPVNKKYDAVITNYPFAQKTRYGDRYPIASRNGDLICPQHCFKSVKDGGRIAMIAPDGFLYDKSDNSYAQLREYLLKHATLKSIISLPRGSFEPYNRAKASILYFEDVRTSKTRDHYWFFNVQNDGYTLDVKRKRIEGTNDLEILLSEKDNVEAQPDKYLLGLGISKITVKEVANNDYVLNAAPYIKLPKIQGHDVLSLSEILEPSDGMRVGNAKKIPIMSITMENGLIDQQDKFKKRIASTNISSYKKVFRNELVMGFPIDEGVLGFQTKYPVAAVSPAYKVWKLLRHDVDITYLEILLRSEKMRAIYKQLMQGAVDRRRSVPDDLFLKIEIPIPGKTIQKKIVEKHIETNEYKKAIKNSEKDIQNNISNLWGYGKKSNK
jgi:type I restriction enzyme M protein